MRCVHATLLAWVCLAAAAGGAFAQSAPGRQPVLPPPPGPWAPPIRNTVGSAVESLRQRTGQRADTIRQAGAGAAQGFGRVVRAGGEVRVGPEGFDYRSPIFGNASVSRLGEVRVNAGVPGIARIVYNRGNLYANVNAYSVRASAVYVPGRFIGVDTPLYGASVSNSGGVFGGSAKYNGVQVSGDTAGNVAAGYSVGPAGVVVSRGADGSLGANGYAEVGGQRVLAAVSNTWGAYVTASGVFGQVHLTSDGRLTLNPSPVANALLRSRYVTGPSAGTGLQSRDGP
jgi:hypothetical protein